MASHWRIFFRQNDIDSRRRRMFIEQSPGNASSHMLQQIRGLAHLTGDNFQQAGIVQGIVDTIGLTGFPYIIMYAKVNHKPSPYPTLLLKHAVEGIKPNPTEKHHTISTLHHTSSSATFSSASALPGRYFFSARSTPFFQVLILSLCNCNDATNLITWAMGMR